VVYVSIGDDGNDATCNVEQLTLQAYKEALSEHERLAADEKLEAERSMRHWFPHFHVYGPSALVRFDVPGTLDYKMAQWMMSDEVKAAIHVTESPAPAWPGPPDGWRYESSYAACSDIAEGDAPSMIDFYREVLYEMSDYYQKTIPIYTDSQVAIKMIEKGHLSNATKHLRISFNEIKEKVDDKEISLFHIPGTENPSDILTKPLPRVTHNKHMDTVLNDSSFVNETAKVVFELRNPNGY